MIQLRCVPILVSCLCLVLWWRLLVQDCRFETPWSQQTTELMGENDSFSQVLQSCIWLNWRVPIFLSPKNYQSDRFTSHRTFFGPSQSRGRIVGKSNQLLSRLDKLLSCWVTTLLEKFVKLLSCSVIKLLNCKVTKLLEKVVKLSSCSAIKLSNCEALKLLSC